MTCRLIEAARAQGESVRALKPIITGWDANDPDAVRQSDTGQLLAALGDDLTPGAIDACSPFRFKEPLSPDMAAARENRGINFDRLTGMCREAIEKTGKCETLYIEGVGGVMVPLNDDKTVLDWIEALNIPVILVVGSYLGTLSHTLTAALALQFRTIAIHSVVISESEDSPVPLEETVGVIQRYLGDAMVKMVRRNDAVRQK